MKLILSLALLSAVLILAFVLLVSLPAAQVGEPFDWSHTSGVRMIYGDGVNIKETVKNGVVISREVVAEGDG